MQILLIEDDVPLAQSLVKALRDSHYVINHVERGRLGLSALKTDIPDIVILDLGLPDMDGIAVLRQLRQQHRELPVLLLTARDTIDDKVTGLDAGADDYLAKPFDMPELLARLRVLERRLSTSKSHRIDIGNVSLDTLQQQVFVDSEVVELSRREFMLLRVLMENAGKVLTRSSLESRLYHWGEEVASNALEVHIHHLRRKLGPGLIHTVRGVGYKIIPSPGRPH